MSRASAWLIAGVAVLATTGVAHAQDDAAAASAAPAIEAPTSAVPWYQRFTTSNGVTESITGQAGNDRLAPAWELNQRWGITVDVREAQRIERLPDGRGDQTSVGAFYQFTPNISLGGELNLETTPAPGALARPQEEEPRADVRIESAFRF